ncbi:NAD(P)-dependent oxidoreductase [Daejeonella lutea]|uniref:D-lactate dehydrogenase n=1 Tax=Daejeonella lutea TaxID=572036 RepID=A0A1T5A550_9SPHI|nr:NAD(P)-dependent oxidoreductase [Daejeonella lutea]SKB30080.1 D-lactate dehydrogenase [Daejeonella lutea]
MKAVAYSIKSCEKEPLIRANSKKHDITLISNRLTLDTVSYAQGKEAVLVFSSDDLSAPVIQKLKELGVKHICTRSTGTDHIDIKEAERLKISVGNIPSYSPESIAEHALALMLSLVRNIIPSHTQIMQYDFTLDDLVGCTIHGKTIGIVGFGQTGKTLAKILQGFGANVLVSDVQDISHEAAALNAKQVDNARLFQDSDIISFHVPLNDETRHLVNAVSIADMKPGVILVNVSRGAVFNSKDVYDALQNGHISKIGMDVYEFEHNVFFFDHTRSRIDDKLLKAFIQNSRVLLTPHQAFLTREALQIIATRTIEHLDKWAGMSSTEKDFVSIAGNEPVPAVLAAKQ